MINLEAGPVFAWATGLLIVALGAFVLLARPKKEANRAFFVFALGNGGQAVWFNTQVGQPSYLDSFFWAWFSLLFAAQAVGAVWLARSPLIGRQGISAWRFWTPMLVCLAVISVFFVKNITDPFYGSTALGIQQDQLFGWRMTLITYPLAVAATAGLGCVAAVRARQDPAQAGSMAAITIGALIWPAIFATFWLSLNVALYGWLVLALVVVAAGWWLHQVRGEMARYARNVAVLPLGLALGGYLLTLRFTDPLALVNTGYFGLGRIVTGGILGFAIVRHQILGFDVKVRRGIKGSTLAALFFAVFFVVSETAAELLGGTQLGPFLGIAVAGGLVFFLAPLQRWADRLAGAATGDAKPIADVTSAEAATIYRRTAAAAWADGALDRKERALLDELAASLKLDGDVTRRIEAEASRA